MTLPIHLGVNVDHVATLRQARLTRYPDPLTAALIAEQAGADSITIHLREDRRHIQERDLKLMKLALLTRVNLEMAATDAMVDMAAEVAPADCCLVPESREELTTEGGLDVVSHATGLKAVCARLEAAGIRVSLFIDPDPAQIDASAAAGAGVVELHTGAYADAETPAARALEFERIRAASTYAAGCGLTVHAGHGLHYHNVEPIAAIPEIVELNIGHSIVAQAVFDGLAVAVARMKALIQSARAS
jgi:pyridoxine 5-phosphate synthase